MTSCQPITAHLGPEQLVARVAVAEAPLAVRVVLAAVLALLLVVELVVVAHVLAPEAPVLHQAVVQLHPRPAPRLEVDPPGPDPQPQHLAVVLGLAPPPPQVLLLFLPGPELGAELRAVAGLAVVVLGLRQRASWPSSVIKTVIKQGLGLTFLLFLLGYADAAPGP